MKLVLLLLAGLWSSSWVKGGPHTTPAPGTTTPAPTTEERLKQLEDVLDGLARQVMLQQFYSDEKTRGDGNSGLKQMRLTRDGSKNFYETGHIGRSFMGMHDHPNYDRTIGLGELNPIMNGIEFRTRHNDYKLRMPSRTSKDYNQVEEIPFPEVPKSVLNKATVQEQVDEMREYFKAFKTQNVTHRDYRPHFKANLCYLEGGWTKATDDIDEPFQSDRHAIDASNWFDLMEKIQFTSYTGSKSVLENFAFLPTTIYRVENGVPLYAQWNYRIVCHPVSKDLPTSVFEPLDDLVYRFPMRQSMSQVINSRAQRFVMNEKKEDRATRGNTMLDNLMMEVPGKDNYPADLHDNSFGMVLEDIRFNNHTPINTGYYHRYYKTEDKGAMGIKTVHRGFNDANLWVAQTTNPKIIDMDVTTCHKMNRHQVCNTWASRYTYALPLEIVYTTPLLKWNPYDLEDQASNPDITGHATRNGQDTPATAFNGTNYKYFFHTPVELFTTQQRLGARDPADTAKKGAAVLDKKGQVRHVSSSGTRILTPAMGDFGQVRLRYPIMPIHGEGASVWKELNALKEMTMHMNRYSSLYEERPTQASGNATDISTGLLHYQMSMTHRDPPGEHTHDFFITKEELDELSHGHHITVTTSEDISHSHVMELQLRRNQVRVYRCDGKNACWDGHGPLCTQIKV